MTEADAGGAAHAPREATGAGGQGPARRPPAPAFALALLCLGALASGAAFLARSDLQQDLAAYVIAGRTRLIGRDPYLNLVELAPQPLWDGVALYRHSRFLYPPVLAELMRPLAMLPYSRAKASFTALCLAALAFAAWMETHPVRGAPPRRRGGGTAVHFALALALGAAFVPVWLTLERGQLDLLLLAALAAAWRARARPIQAGVWLALALVAKPMLFLLLPVLASARRWRWVAATGATLAALGALGMWLSGPALTRAYLFTVLPRAARFGEGGPAEWLLPDAAIARATRGLAEGMARVAPESRLYAQQLGEFARNASLARTWSQPAMPPAPLCLAIALVLGGGLAWRAARAPEDARPFWGAALAAVTAAPVSWAMSLTWALPLLWLALGGVLRARRVGDETTSSSVPGARPGSAAPAPGLPWLVAGLVLATLGPWLGAPCFPLAALTFSLAALAPPGAGIDTEVEVESAGEREGPVR